MMYFQSLGRANGDPNETSWKMFLEHRLERSWTSLRLICCSWHFSKWLLLQAVKVFPYQQLLLKGKFKVSRSGGDGKARASLPCLWDGDVYWKSPSRTVTWLDCTHEVHCAHLCTCLQQATRCKRCNKQKTRQRKSTYFLRRYVFSTEVYRYSWVIIVEICIAEKDQMQIWTPVEIRILVTWVTWPRHEAWD